MTLEELVTQLEKEVAELKEQVSAQQRAIYCGCHVTVSENEAINLSLLQKKLLSGVIFDIREVNPLRHIDLEARVNR